MLMQIMMLVQMTVVYNTAVKYGGPSQIALMGASQHVLQLAFVPIWGMSQGMQPAVGTNYGAKNYDRVRQLTNIFILGSTGLALFFYVIIQLFPAAVLSAFIKDASIVADGLTNFRTMFSIFPTYGLLIMTITYFQSLGKGGKAGMLAILRQIVLVVPLVLILPRIFGIFGVWLALPANDAIILVLAIILILSEYRNLEQEKALAS
ncbi:MAG: MATE family efflux transporter [Lachnospiraceae bacterium]